jgi:DedD protein
MRDLDRLQEQDPDERGRTLATLAVLATVIVGLFGAAFAYWSRAAGLGGADGGAPDPLDNLLHAPLVASAESPTAEAPPVSIDPAKLSFERTLAGSKLELSAADDKRMAAIPPKAAKDAGRAPAAEAGDFLLHVISYESRAPAEALARALRERGHEAFVVSGEVNGRGRYYRVRIGPFASKQAADAYRRTFEIRERMNTIVVRRED